MLLFSVMSLICTCQYPVGLDTGTQNSGDAMCSVFQSPNVISDCSESLSDRKTEKSGFFRFLLEIRRSIKLKFSPCDIWSSARPSTPSKLNELNGSSVSSVAATKLPRVHEEPIP